MTKFSAYIGYAVSLAVNFVQRRFFRLAALGIGLVALYVLLNSLYIFEIDSRRFLDYTQWFHDYMVSQGTPG